MNKFSLEHWMIMFDSVVLSKTFFLRESFLTIKNKKLKFIGILCDMQTLWLTVCANKRWKMKDYGPTEEEREEVCPKEFIAFRIM